MPGVLFDAPITRWVCPNCPIESVTTGFPGPGMGSSQMHQCTNGLLMPLVPEGTACKVETVERDDYVGDELVQTDNEGRPVMATVTTRDDGQDVTVYAPTARNGQ